MFKKLIVGVIAFTLVAGVLLGSNAMSYLTTSCERVSETVENSIPLEFQIDRARKMVRDLEPEVRRSMHVIAKEEVEVEQLDTRISSSESKSGKEKSEIMRLQSDLQTGKSVFQYAGRSYSTGEVLDALPDSRLPTPLWPAYVICATHVSETSTRPVKSWQR